MTSRVPLIILQECASAPPVCGDLLLEPPHIAACHYMVSLLPSLPLRTFALPLPCLLPSAVALESSIIGVHPLASHLVGLLEVITYSLLDVLTGSSP